MDLASLWTTILGEIELDVSRAHFASFFKGTALGRTDNQVAEIVCPNQASSLMLKSRFSPLIKLSLKKHLKTNFSLKFLVSFKKPSAEQNGPLFALQNNPDQALFGAGLNPHYTFENFAVSESNQMAYAAAQAVANKPGSAYNPLFLWGSVGVGKTHLMQALGREVVVKNPQTKVIYCTGEDFTNGIIEAIKERSAGVFKKKYRSSQLLLVDDVQFIAGKESVQMEFFHTFNSILQNRGQVVLVSDKPPGEIEKLEKRLCSRFGGGLTVDVSPPNFELRTAILLIKAGERGVELPIETAKTLAANFEDTRALQGALLRYLTEKEKKGGVDHQEIVGQIINQPSPNKERGRTHPQKVLEVFASHFNLKVGQLRGKKRKRSVARPRQLLMYILRQEIGLSYKEIGSFLGGRDHSTIIHGVEKISSLLPKKETLRQNLSQVRRSLWG